MKRNLIYILLAATVAMAFSCKKEVSMSDALTGTWELSVDYGGWSGIHNHKPGNDTLVVFTSNTYSFYQKGTLVKSGSYTTKKDTVYMFGKLGNRLILQGEEAGLYPREFYTIQNNQLNIFMDAYDAGGTTYRRIK